MFARLDKHNLSTFAASVLKKKAEWYWSKVYVTVDYDDNADDDDDDFQAVSMLYIYSFVTDAFNPGSLF
jgi:hypothetical protein